MTQRDPDKTCRHCRGTGYVTTTEFNGVGYTTTDSPCWACFATGSREPHILQPQKETPHA